MKILSPALLQIHLQDGGAAVVAGMAGAWAFLGFAISVLAAICLFLEASHLRRNSAAGPWMFPPILWALLALIADVPGLVALVFLFYALHNTSWFERRASSPKVNLSLHEVHEQRMQMLETELAELREQNRDE